MGRKTDLWRIFIGFAMGTAFLGCGGEGSSNHYCVSLCSPWERSCTDGREKYCEIGPDGCYRWSTPQFCQNGQVCVGDECGACWRHSQCQRADVCITGRCEAGSGREYSFKFLNASIPERNSLGLLWDIAGLPDPYVELRVDGKLVGKTRTKQDTLSPVWNESLPYVRIYESSEVVIRIYDEDPLGFELIDSVRLIGPLDFARSGSHSARLHKNSAVSLSWEIKAR